MAPPVRRQRPVRTLVALAVMLVALFATIAAGSRWSTASFAPKLALDLEGGTQIVLSPVSTDPDKITDATINQAIQVIRQRIDASGVSEAEITSQTGHKIVVSLPGRPSEETLELVRKSAKMEFRPVLQLGAGTPTATASPSANGTSSAAPAPSATSELSSPGATATATAAAKITEDSTASPSAAASTAATAQAGDDASAAASDTAQPTPSGSPTSPSDSTYYVTAQVQKQFDTIDCSDKANLTGGRVGDPNLAFVTCSTDGSIKYLLGPVEVEGQHISKASSGLETLSNGQTGTNWVVNLQFDSQGTTDFAKTSARLFKETSPKNQFGIVLDGLVIEAPSMNGVIADGKAQISGSFTRESAAALAQQLNFGSLPITFEVESEQQISATLGSEQLQRGLLAGVIGLILVVIYSLIQYRVLGLLTVGSLLVAGLATYGTIAILSWLQGYRLSLPGVAGLIVAIGITADSFIVYFERIRDELRDGRSLPGAVDHGWSRARRTILASDAVNFLAAAVLYVVAVSSVRGFAFTLGLTTIVDLVVVFLFTHPAMLLLARTGFFGGGHRFSGLDPRRLGVEVTRYVGRGRVATGPRTTGAAGDATSASREPAVATATATTARTVSPAVDTTMTIAERRAAAKAAQAGADAPPAEQTGATARAAGDDPGAPGTPDTSGADAEGSEG